MLNYPIKQTQIGVICCFSTNL